MIGRGLESFARALLVIASLLALASCGSGAVGPVVNDPSKITIMPGSDGTTATLYSGLPTTFTITGGNGTYIVSSSNQAIVQVSGPLAGNTLTVIPNPVLADTTLTLTARDTGTTSPATVSLVVRPGTVSNTITVTPGSSACSPAVCSGGDAVVTATIAQGGIPLPARGVRFSVVSGDIRFITSPAGLPETTALSVDTTTDETGAARARMRANDTAANQTAIIQITDLGSGAYQRSTVLVARTTATQSAYFTVPESVTFTGPNNQTCASGISSEVFVFGGTPPYTISNSAPSAFTTNTNVVGFSGGSFRVTPTGICADNVAIGVTDAAARTITVTLTNKVGSAAVPAPPAFTVAPTSVTLNSCTATASVFAAGGQGTYSAASSNSVVLTSVNGGLVSIRRTPGSNATGITTVSVAVSDGATVKTVDVSLTGAGAGVCP